MKILQISTMDVGGGAESVARQLFARYRDLGHDSRLSVGLKMSDDPDVVLLDAGQTRGRGAALHDRISAAVCRERGRENFNHPGIHHLLDRPEGPPDVIHCHNLHGPFLPGGGYFDLRILPRLSERFPVILTLHDAWLLSGHCAHSFDCDRWRTGCGHCPDLTIYPSLKRDATAANWRLKRKIFARSRLYVSTMSHWLMDKIERSILAPAAIQRRVIRNGIDLSVFRPGDKATARSALGIEPDARVVLSVAHVIRSNLWKDYATSRAAMIAAADHREGPPLIFLAVGNSGPPEKFKNGEIRFVPHVESADTCADYYRAADLYLHAAKADTFPTTVLEAMACGTPVVGSAVGGIPEQVRGLQYPAHARTDDGQELNRYGRDAATGVLVPPGDGAAMATCIERLLEDAPLRRQLGANGAREARARFDLNLQADTYLDWYRTIVERHRRHPVPEMTHGPDATDQSRYQSSPDRQAADRASRSIMNPRSGAS